MLIVVLVDDFHTAYPVDKRDILKLSSVFPIEFLPILLRQ